MSEQTGKVKWTDSYEKISGANTIGCTCNNNYNNYVQFSRRHFAWRRTSPLCLLCSAACHSGLTSRRWWPSVRAASVVSVWPSTPSPSLTRPALCRHSGLTSLRTRWRPSVRVASVLSVWPSTPSLSLPHPPRPVSSQRTDISAHAVAALSECRIRRVCLAVHPVSVPPSPAPPRVVTADWHLCARGGGPQWVPRPSCLSGRPPRLCPSVTRPAPCRHSGLTSLRTRWRPSVRVASVVSVWSAGAARSKSPSRSPSCARCCACRPAGRCSRRATSTASSSTSPVSPQPRRALHARAGRFSHFRVHTGPSRYWMCFNFIFKIQGLESAWIC